MKKLFLLLVCLGMLVGCGQKNSSSTSSLEKDFEGYSQIIETASHIEKELNNDGLSIQYTKRTDGTYIHTNYEADNFEIKMSFDKESQKFVSLSLQHNYFKRETKREECNDLLEAILKLDTFNMDSKVRDDIKSYILNSEDESVQNMYGYIIERESASVIINQLTDESLTAYNTDQKKDSEDSTNQESTDSSSQKNPTTQGSSNSSQSKPASSSSSGTSQSKPSTSGSSSTSQKPSTGSSSSTSQKPSTGSSSSMTTAQSNAVKKAKNYLSVSAFSRQGLIDQLIYEKFSTSDATYGADHCGANWNEQALKKAKSYLSVSAFSKKGLQGQLEYEEFTSSQVKYAIDRCGANWNEQAAKKAKSYLSISAFSRDGLIDQLLYDGFTQSQAEYGVNAAGL